MPPKRRRACEACHAAKVRCELTILSSNSTRPCKRCRRAGRDCFPAAPRLQRIRIAELEAQVEALATTNKIQNDFNFDSPPVDSQFRGYSVAPLQERPDAKDHDTAVFPLVQFATNVGIDIGISGPQRVTTPGAYTSPLQKFAVTSAITTVMRQADANPWTAHHDECLEHIQTHSEVSEVDTHFCQLVDVERLCYTVATRSGLCDQSPPLALSDTQQRIAELRLKIERWSKETPGLAQQPLLLFNRHVAILYLNEAVLHTQTNKATFAAPFVPEKIAPADFASPAVTIDHIGSLYAIRDNCHAALDLALSMDLTTTLPLSPVSLYPRVLYAIFVLVKLYVAVTAPCNTYGTILSNAELRLEEYFDKLRSQASTLVTVVPTSSASMTFTACSWLEDWFVGYKAIAEEYERRMNLELIWTPSVATSPQKLGVQVQSTDYAIRPNDLVGMDHDNEQQSNSHVSGPKQYAWRHSEPGLKYVGHG